MENSQHKVESKDCFEGKVEGDGKSKTNNYNKDQGNYKKMYAVKNRYVKKLSTL